MRDFYRFFIPSEFADIIRLAVNILIRRSRNTVFFAADGWGSRELFAAIPGQKEEMTRFPESLDNVFR